MQMWHVCRGAQKELYYCLTNIIDMVHISMVVVNPLSRLIIHLGFCTQMNIIIHTYQIYKNCIENYCYTFMHDNQIF